MDGFKEKEYKIFEMFDKEWALVTAGSTVHYNTCTVGWGSFGTLWGGKPTITVYVHPARYTSEFLKENDTFTVSFFPESCKKALGYLGSHSGRDGDKVLDARCHRRERDLQGSESDVPLQKTVSAPDCQGGPCA